MSRTARRVATRFGHLVTVLLAVTILTFGLFELLPGDPVDAIAPLSTTAEQAAVRDDLRVGEGLVARYVGWLTDIATGDLGHSYVDDEPIADLISDRLAVSALLLTYTQVVALGVSIPLALVSARRARRRVARVASGVSFALVSLPAYVLAILGLYALTVRWDVVSTVYDDATLRTRLATLFVPALSLALPLAARYARLWQTEGRDAVRSVRANRALRSSHRDVGDGTDEASGRPVPPASRALRPLARSLLVVVAVQLGALVGAMAVVETLFKVPGLGGLFGRAILVGDYPVIVALVLVTSLGYAAVVFAARLLADTLDRAPSAEPRRAQVHGTVVFPESAGDEQILATLDPTDRARSATARSDPQGERHGRGWGFWIGVGWLVLVVGLAILAPVLGLPDPERPGFGPPLHSPGVDFLLGTDIAGRDLFARTVWGARVTLTVAATSTVLALALGTALGGAAHLFRRRSTRRRIDAVTLWGTDVLIAFPAVILASALVAFLGTGLLDVVIAITVVSVAPFARLTRATMLTNPAGHLGRAASPSGTADERSRRRTILADVVANLPGLAMLGLAIAIVVEGALGILGLGVTDAGPLDAHSSWGLMIREGVGALSLAPWVAIAPAGAIYITVLACNVIARHLHERLAIRARRRHEASDARGSGPRAEHRTTRE